MENTAKISKTRYHLIDSIRGFALLNMVAFHLLYDLLIIFSVNTDWAFQPFTFIWERFICFSFIIISGVALNFSNNSFKRSIILNIFGFLITIVTVLVIPQQAVWFGILNFLGCAMMIMHPLKIYAEKTPPLAGAVFCLLIFMILYGLPDGYIGFGSIELLKLPDFLYKFKWLAFIGLPSVEFYSTDYFPIFPWIFLFATGYFVWRFIRDKGLDRFFTLKIPVLSFIGRHTMIVYIVHQPVIMAVLYIISYTI